MAKCNCGAQTCGCRLVAGENITLTGAGTARDPWVISGAAGGGGSSGWSAGDRKETYRNDTPSGWIVCDGRAYSRATYANLFAAIGTRFGSGDGVNTFNVPNETGRVAIGSGPGYPQDSTGGTATTTLTVPNLPAHTHSINHDHGAFTSGSGGAHDHRLTMADGVGGSTLSVPRGNNVDAIKTPAAVESDGTHTHSINVPAFSGTSGATGAGAAFTNLPPYRAIRVLIKT